MGESFLSRSDQHSFLLVGNDDNLRRIEATYLVEMGYKSIHHAANGAEAWSALKNHTISLVVSSWELSDISGLVLLRFIRAGYLVQ
jgi:DNA-binding response OmpR family regulator